MSIATAIADAQQKVANAYLTVSNKGGTLPASRNLSNLSVAINSIPSGGGTAPVIQQLDITPTTSSQVYNPVSGVDGYGPVNVSAVTSAIDNNILATNIKSGVSILGVTGNVVESVEDTLSVTPSTSAQTFTPTSPYTGYNQINVSAVDSNIDANILAGNIKNGVTILGITGNYTGLVPSGSLSIGQNGTYDVTNYASAVVSVSGAAAPYSVTFTKDANNKLQGGTTAIDLTGATDIGDYVLAYKYYNNYNVSGTVDMSDLTTISGEYACYWMYMISNETSGITSVDISSLTSITGQYACSSMFQRRLIPSVDLSSLNSITGYRACSNMFYDNALTSSNLLPSLTTINGYSACNGMFGKNPLTSMTFPSLTYIDGYEACSSMFSECSNLATLSFPALTSNSFGNRTDYFNLMLYGVTGCTVHFPSNLQSVIGSWSDVLQGFGGTNTTVLFDLPATE